MGSNAVEPEFFGGFYFTNTLSYLYNGDEFSQIVTVTFENVCRLAYETSSFIKKNALEYNVYHRCLCYILNQATMA